MSRSLLWSLPLAMLVGCSHMRQPTPYAPKPYLMDLEHGDGPDGVQARPGEPATPGTTPAASGGPAPGAVALPEGSPLPELVGKWCYMANVQANDGGRQSNTCFQLNADGTFQYHSETSSSGQYGGTASQSDDEGRWQAAGNTLTAQSTSGKVTSYNFEKRNHPKTNDPMLVFDGQAFVTFYQKPPW